MDTPITAEQNNDFQGVLQTTVDAVLKKSLAKSFVSYTNLQNTYTLSFNHTYNNVHTINAVIGYEQYKEYVQRLIYE